MAESSITHNFIFRGQEVAERLAKILEESANDPTRTSTVSVKFLDDPDELREFLLKVKQANAQQDAVESRNVHAAQASDELQANTARATEEE